MYKVNKKYIIINNILCENNVKLKIIFNFIKKPKNGGNPINENNMKVNIILIIG
jgi:hypothetical protein